MNPSAPRGTILALVCAGVVAACVPRGAPPAGQQIVADRTSVPIAFVGSRGDGSTRLLITRPGDDPFSVDLWAVALDPAGAPPVERLLVPHVTSLNSGLVRYGGGSCGGTDSRGRMLVFTGDATNPQGNLTRIDPVTGDRSDLGPAEACYRSASGQQLLVGHGATGTLYDAADQATPVDASSAGFAGEDLYYVSGQQQLVRRSPDGTTATLATGVQSFTLVPTDAGLAVLLRRPTTDGTLTSQTMLDVRTGQETPLVAADPFFSLSPDGRWFLQTDPQTGASEFFDWRTGEHRPVEVPAGAQGGGYFWRPGHDELWFISPQPWQALTSVRNPDGGGADYPLWPVSLYDMEATDIYATIFTVDGKDLFAFPALSPDARSAVPQVGPADDPSGPRFDLVPAGSRAGGYWRLADGRLLIASWTATPDLSNLSAIDPSTGERNALGEQAQVLAVGGTRVLVNQHLVDHAGDLTVFELATGRATVLADEFALAAAVEPLSGDAVAPGARVAFRFEARFASPYDGIWLATVP